MSDLDPLARPPASSWRERIELLTEQRPSARAAVGAGALVVVLAVAGWLLLRPPAGPPLEELLPLAGAAAPTSGGGPSSAPTTAGPATDVVVHAAGAVTVPGVYRLAAGARVADLLDAAGGPAADADIDQLNLAAPVLDGQRVYVPRVGEVAAPAAVDGSGGSTPSGPLDLNTATLEQLEDLPGVGPATAQAIITERDRRGGFRAVDDLLDVRGIGPAKLDALRDLVTV